MTSETVFVAPPELLLVEPDDELDDEFDELPHALNASTPMIASAETPVKRTLLSTDSSSRRNDVVNFPALLTVLLRRGTRESWC